MVDITEIADPASELVQRGLKRWCSICKTRGPCRNTIQPGHPLPGRAIHLERATKPDKDTEPVEKDGS